MYTTHMLPWPRYGVHYGRTHKAAVRRLNSRSVYDELGIASNDAIERLVNPAPYYNLSMCRRSLTLVQLAIAAVEGGYRPVECFNHAVDGGIVFG